MMTTDEFICQKMALFLVLCTLWFVRTAVLVSAENTFNKRAGLNVECLGSVMRLTFDKSLAFGSHLAVGAINGSQTVPLTPDLAAKCGYSMESDPWGNTKLYTSLLSCFTKNQQDQIFDIGLRLQMYGNQVSEDDVHEIKQTCEYKQWASREILCERNFMEVSVNRFPPEMSIPKQQSQDRKGFQSGASPEAPTSLCNIWRMVFYTPKEKPMMLEDAQKAGYGVSTTPFRLVLRSPYNMAETYTQNVNGVQMSVFKVTTYFKREWAVTMMDTTAACPTGGLHFTDDMITWYMPRVITPLTTFQGHDILELYMGIDGKRIDLAHMNVMGYTLALTDSQIIVTLPVGGPDGYHKSHALKYEYHTTYSIEPMLEILWLEAKSDLTRYKVHYPITTPPRLQQSQMTDNTVAEKGCFDILLGTFLHDVELMNITFSTGVLTVEEASARGFNVQQHGFPNGSKAFTIQVPFSDPVVVKASVNRASTTYTLPLIFGFIILPEYTPFPQPALVEITLQDIILPTVRGICDEENFYVFVEFGNQGKNFNIMVGKQDLADLYTEYGIQENSTHMNMTVPFLANGVVFELAYESSVRGRFDMMLWDPVNNWNIKNFSLACNFPLTMTECFSNGTMTALAVKVESASHVVPSQLALNDPSCKPTFSNSRFAYFSFDANSCGTTRMFYDDVMVYQNEVSLVNRRGASPQDSLKNGLVSGYVEQEYRLTVSCYYMLNDTQTVTFFTKPRRYEPFAESGVGELKVRMRLAKDPSYKTFYEEKDYPLVQYLREPLFFEVQLVQSADLRIELVLDNCWAVVNDGVSTMSWDLIVNGCENLKDRYQTTFHPVAFDERVQFPLHIKRFEVKMFTFVKDNAILRDQIIVHCEAVICDINQTDALCKRRCPQHGSRTTIKGRRSTSLEQLHRMHVSSGKVVLSNF
ncbi:zona pellucida protein AX 1 [Hoplias malabaricus]|uniref:zona pellucida protein AX 1 n=1 Tax=Hoplias malabaricus TaxID=27720 RepID=UPI003462751F